MTGGNAPTLSDEQLDRLADLLAIKLARVRPASPPMLTVEDISATLQVSRAWVYENAGRLGGFKLGPGERAPLRFDPALVQGALMPLALATDAAPASESKSGAARKRRSPRLHPVYDG
jgi:hypothetical protein